MTAREAGVTDPGYRWNQEGRIWKPPFLEKAKQTEIESYETIIENPNDTPPATLACPYHMRLPEVLYLLLRAGEAFRAR